MITRGKERLAMALGSDSVSFEAEPATDQMGQLHGAVGGMDGPPPPAPVDLIEGRSPLGGGNRSSGDDSKQADINDMMSMFQQVVDRMDNIESQLVLSISERQFDGDRQKGGDKPAERGHGDYSVVSPTSSRAHPSGAIPRTVRYNADSFPEYNTGSDWNGHLGRPGQARDIFMESGDRFYDDYVQTRPRLTLSKPSASGRTYFSDGNRASGRTYFSDGNRASHVNLNPQTSYSLPERQLFQNAGNSNSVPGFQPRPRLQTLNSEKEDLQVRLRPYSPKDTSWYSYREYFNSIAKLVGWSDRAKCAKLLSVLQGSLTGINIGEDSVEFADLVSRLDFVHGISIDEEDAENQLESMVKKPDEAIAMYAERVRQLIESALHT